MKDNIIEKAKKEITFENVLATADKSTWSKSKSCKVSSKGA